MIPRLRRSLSAGVSAPAPKVDRWVALLVPQGLTQAKKQSTNLPLPLKKGVLD